jgi:uncharacterized protein
MPTSPCRALTIAAPFELRHTTCRSWKSTFSLPGKAALFHWHAPCFTGRDAFRAQSVRVRNVVLVPFRAIVGRYTHHMVFAALVAVVAVLAGAIASVAGFGIGSVLTPLFSTRFGVQLGVAMVAIPHFAATLLRWWRLRSDVDRTTFVRFGIPSVLGGLAGAVLHSYVRSALLGIVFGCLLVFSGSIGITGLSKRMRFGRRAAWAAGALSSALGGLVGNQGSIRSAALLGFDLDKESFVATGTAVGVVVDLARLPVYLATDGGALLRMWPIIAVATAGTLIGTVAGERVLRRIPEPAFRTVVSVVILILGIAMLAGIGR